MGRRMGLLLVLVIAWPVSAQIDEPFRDEVPLADLLEIVILERQLLPRPCSDAVRDQAGGGCIPASRTPALGALYPLSSDLFIDPITGVRRMAVLLTACLLVGATPARAEGVNLLAQLDPFPGNNRYGDVWGEGDYAYLGSFAGAGVMIIDISTPSAPFLAT